MTLSSFNKMEIFGILGIIFIIISLILIIKTNKDKNNIKQINYDIENHNNNLINHNKILVNNYNSLKQKENEILINIDKQMSILNNVNKTIETNLQNQKQLSAKAFENYCDLLDNEYEKQVQEYEQLCNVLNSSYEKLQLNKIEELQKVQDELEAAKKTRAAIIAAQVKEKEIKEQLSFYCLKAKEVELSDIKILEKIKGQLNNPRILSMLIWQTYWQKPMTTLCNNVLGSTTVCGIYKITNQLTGECYIGQAVDIATRWKQHAKCGLGIDTPVNNKLYKAIQEYGIWNFSWELIEKCNALELNQKEKYYIELYQAYAFGYNSNTGIKNN